MQRSNKLLLVVSALILFNFCSDINKNGIEESDKEFIKTNFSDVPEWSKNVVWYQIFVERFRNGDPTNDPTPEDIDGTYPGIIPDGWKVTPWTQDWYKPDPYFIELDGKNDNQGNPIESFGQKAQLRRYGGDLQGVINKLII